MNQLNLFSQPQHKGSSEWGAFNAVREDSVGMFRVMTPRKQDEPRYTNVIKIRRLHQPHQLFFKGAH